MKRLVLVVPALAWLLACSGGGGGKPSCSATAPCAAGSYCAHTADGNVCWPDSAAPVISAAALTCPTGTTACRRDAALTLTATVTDESAMGAVMAVIDGDVEHPRTLAHVSGSTYALELPPSELPFPYFEHAVTAVVKAVDQAGNVATKDCEPLMVTRAKWAKQLKGAGDTAFPLYSPALLADGTIVVAGGDGSVHFVNKASGEESRPAVSIGSVVSSPPAVGADAVWMATQDGKLHQLQLDGTIVSLPVNCNTAQPLIGPPAVSGQHAFVGSKSAVVLAANAAAYCNRLALSSEVSSPPAVTASGHVLLATGAVLRSYSLNAGEDIIEDWSGVAPAPIAPALSGLVAVGMSVDVDGAAWTTAQSGAVDRTTSGGTSGAITSVSAGSMGGIALADGSAVLSDAAKRLVRVRATGSVPWSSSDSFTGVPAVGLALKGSIPTILVPTDQGSVYAVNQADGHVQWSAELASQSLQPANIWTDPGATTSTAYLAGADGTLYAIIVDGALDTAAPWPKAFHDPQNTSNAGVTP